VAGIQKAATQRRKSFTAARRRALARLKKGLDLRWAPSKIRDELYNRDSDKASGR
jgi:hypothetical protein